MIVLKIIFIIFVAGFLFALSLGWSFLKRVNEVKKQMNRQNKDFQHQQQSRTYGNQEGVVDQRNPEKANQKIFPKDEGEYVDYTEE